VQIEMTATDGVEDCETVWFYLWRYSVRDCSRSHVAFVLCCLIVGEQKWTDKEDIGLQMRFFCSSGMETKISFQYNVCTKLYVSKKPSL